MPCTPRPSRQLGIAALEFAIAALFVLIPTFLGLSAYWDILQTQQVVTRSTGDGARQAQRVLQQPWTLANNGVQPTPAQVQGIAAELIRTAVSKALKDYLGEEVDSDLLTVTHQQVTQGLAFDVSYARPAMFGSAGGLNIIEPTALKARSVILQP